MIFEKKSRELLGIMKYFNLKILNILNLVCTCTIINHFDRDIQYYYKIRT